MSDSNQFSAFVVGLAESDLGNVSQVGTTGSLGELNWCLVRFSNLDEPREIAEIDFLKSSDGVLVQIEYSALNYKDALVATGHPGVARRMPLVPGIDAVGTVAKSDDPRFSIGDEVLIAHALFGTAEHGGWSGFANVSGDWIYKLPPGLSCLEAATWGTAGFTAAQSVQRIVEMGIQPEDGPVLVTGATGGVGIFAVKLLSKLGYQVVASTGKSEKQDWLIEHGASHVIPREQLNDATSTPLLKGQWAAAVDTVGGNTLATVLRSAQPHACVTACGLVAGYDLPLTVYPFILRGVSLCGIDSAGISRETRQTLWNKIGSDWKLDGLSELAQVVSLSEVPNSVEQILAGKVFGRTIVKTQD